MILVAGIGNVFLGDDGFGVEVVRRLAQRNPKDALVVDFGTRGLDLAYALLEPWDAAIFVDAAQGKRAPGALWVIEPDLDGGQPGLALHGVGPLHALQTARAMGPLPRALRVVCCEPERLVGKDESLTQELSAPVAAAVERAVALVEALVHELAHA
jgi:hydrogenase maturation protease